MEASQIVVPGVVGLIMTFVIPLILRQSWPRWARLAVSVVLAAGVAAAVIVAKLHPESWETIAAGLAMAVAVAQVVYQALKPTGLFEWLSAATNPEAKRAIDTIPETTV